MKSKLVLLLALALLVAGLPSYAATNTPALLNGGFEGGWHLATTYWTPEGGPFHHQFIEITPPDLWTAWWFEGFPCVGHPTLQGRPEVRIIGTTPDRSRVHSGCQALKFFTFWRCHRGGVYQKIAVEPGKHYTLQVYAHSWFSDCDRRPHHYIPLEEDCRTPYRGAHNWLRIGIDPLGGIDPRAGSVEWCLPKEIYGRYVDPLRLEHVLAISDTATVFLESVTSHPLKHDDVYWDEVTFGESHQIFLPTVTKEK